MANNAENAMENYKKMVSDMIISSIEKGVAPWEKPWSVEDMKMLRPHNPESGSFYQGNNALTLVLASVVKGYNDSRWMTYNQAKKAGGTVRSGEKSIPLVRVIYGKEEPEVDEQGRPIVNDKGKLKMKYIPFRVPVVTKFNLFNVKQIDFPLEHEYSQPIKPEALPTQSWDDYERAEQMIKDTDAKISYSGTQAYYRPSSDEIYIPPKELFSTQEGFYSTVFHELSHWTGAESRLNRHYGAKGTKAYAQEELVAEISSFMICLNLGIGHNLENHATYVNSWNECLHDNKQDIIDAVDQAFDAQKYITKLCRDKEKDRVNAVNNADERIYLVNINNAEDMAKLASLGALLDDDQRTYITQDHELKDFIDYLPDDIKNTLLHNSEEQTENQIFDTVKGVFSDFSQVEEYVHRNNNSLSEEEKNKLTEDLQKVREQADALLALLQKSEEQTEDLVVSPSDVEVENVDQREKIDEFTQSKKEQEDDISDNNNPKLYPSETVARLITDFNNEAFNLDEHHPVLEPIYRTLARFATEDSLKFEVTQNDHSIRNPNKFFSVLKEESEKLGNNQAYELLTSDDYYNSYKYNFINNILFRDIRYDALRYLSRETIIKDPDIQASKNNNVEFNNFENLEVTYHWSEYGFDIPNDKDIVLKGKDAYQLLKKVMNVDKEFFNRGSGCYKTELDIKIGNIEFRDRFGLGEGEFRYDTLGESLIHIYRRSFDYDMVFQKENALSEDEFRSKLPKELFDLISQEKAFEREIENTEVLQPKVQTESSIEEDIGYGIPNRNEEVENKEINLKAFYKKHVDHSYKSYVDTLYDDKGQITVKNADDFKNLITQDIATQEFKDQQGAQTDWNNINWDAEFTRYQKRFHRRDDRFEDKKHPNWERIKLVCSIFARNFVKGYKVLHPEKEDELLSNEKLLQDFSEKTLENITSYREYVNQQIQINLESISKGEDSNYAKLADYMLNDKKAYDVLFGNIVNEIVAKDLDKEQSETSEEEVSQTSVQNSESKVESTTDEVEKTEEQTTTQEEAQTASVDTENYTNIADVNDMDSYLSKDISNVPNREYLNVDFSEKNAVKSMGAQWDKDKKKWYVEGELIDDPRFEQWRKPKVVNIQEETVVYDNVNEAFEAFKRDLNVYGCKLDERSFKQNGDQISGRVSVPGDKQGEKGATFYFHTNENQAVTGILYDFHQANRVVFKRTYATVNSINNMRARNGQSKRYTNFGNTQPQQPIIKNQVQRKVSNYNVTNAVLLEIKKYPKAQHHSYLVKKGIQPTEGTYIKPWNGNNYLSIPMVDINGKITGCQYIREDGSKTNKLESNKKGAFHPINGIQTLANKPAIIIAEGYATACTINEVTKNYFGVVSSFGSDNISDVAEKLHERYPESLIVIAADNDHKHSDGHNVGIESAQHAAQKVNGVVVIPNVTQGNDFNDLYKEKGLESVRAEFLKVLEELKKRKNVKQEIKQQKGCSR